MGKGKEEVFKLNGNISIEHMDINWPEGWKLAEVSNLNSSGTYSIGTVRCYMISLTAEARKLGLNIRSSLPVFHVYYLHCSLLHTLLSVKSSLPLFPRRNAQMLELK